MTKITDENKDYSFHIGLCFSKSQNCHLDEKVFKKKKKKTLNRLKIRDKQFKKFHPNAN